MFVTEGPKIVSTSTSVGEILLTPAVGKSTPAVVITVLLPPCISIFRDFSFSFSRSSFRRLFIFLI